MDVTAVVVAGARAGSVDTLAPVGGVPMVVRAVRSLLDSGVVRHVLLLESAARADAVLLACAGLPVGVLEGPALIPVPTPTARRAPAAPGDEDAGGLVLVHDAARPLAPPELAVSVLDAARSGSAAVVPVLPLADTVKRVDADGTVLATTDRTALRVVQTPQVIRRGSDARLLAAPLTAAVLLAAAGPTVATVPGHPLAFAVRTAWELELAELLVGRSGS